MLRLHFRVALVGAVLGGAPAVGAQASPAAAGPLTVFSAGSLARPLRRVLDSFATRERVTTAQESAGSLELARRITDLEQIPDVIALADREIFPALLVPRSARWYAEFARNRMVIAFTPRSRFAHEITPVNWTNVLLRPGVETGRSDPNADPNGYRTLLTLQLAERHYAVPGLANRLLATMPMRNVRPKSSDLVALVQAGQLDYIWAYESTAQAARLEYLRLPPEIDLGDPAQRARYAEATVWVAGHSRGDSVLMRGGPIVYALSIPTGAPHPDLAARFVAFLLSPDGRRLLHAAELDALERPVIVGEGVPDAVRRALSP
jgi:molybdate/tungstate transport system substrate-binding protein